jgi:4'-phosphopantetheinyl transferase
MKTFGDSIEIWNVHLPDHAAEEDRCRSILADDEMERASKFRIPADRSRFILCRGLLRRILGNGLNRSPESIRFFCSEHGKPFLAGHELEFNVSHSRDRLLVAVTCGRAVGVDIEFRRSGLNMAAIAKRWFAPNEQQFFQTLENPEDGFFDIWAKKEAYVKALGAGIYKDLNSFEVPTDRTANIPMPGNSPGWFFQTLEIDPAYAAALVWRADRAEEPVQVVTQTLESGVASA